MANSELRVMTFNIRNSRANDGPNGWQHRREMVAALIRAQRADVVGIQEAFPEQVADLRGALPEYGGIGVGRDDGGAEGEHCLILYRTDRLHVKASGTFWFSDTPETPGTTHWGNRVVRICTWARFIDGQTQAAFSLYNLHIDHESQTARERSLQLLLERLRQRKDADPILVTGDFNAGEDNPVLDILRGATDPVLKDTFRVAHPDEKVVSTYHDFHGGTENAKIDYIFASPEFSVIGSDILRDSQDGRFPSDHYPVTAQLTLVA
jgi:endonuclease/exonuclease/phosphatase family metal-dependent hydrolase